jgi:hypothetical protein
MGRHIIRAFLVMLENRIIIGNQTLHKTLHIAKDGWIGVLANHQGRTGVANKDIAQALVHARLLHQTLYFEGDVITTSAPGLDQYLISA